jgi:hypothetical protein
MNEPNRMRRHDCLERLLREAVKIDELQRPARQHLLKRVALDQLHDDVGTLDPEAVIEDGDDVGMLQAVVMTSRQVCSSIVRSLGAPSPGMRMRFRATGRSSFSSQAR